MGIGIKMPEFISDMVEYAKLPEAERHQRKADIMIANNMVGGHKRQNMAINGQKLDKI